MGYQAILFCPDEKLARIVSQVFDEVDFVIDPVNDPFATVKKLMARHYDVIVVDCENQQNSSLLFKSAHNSPFNQNSLAIALVEGQAGVAQAYRIGANLVLTKPINVEQAKGTLRVARGLLRKSADAATATAASKMTRGVPVKETPAAPAHSVGPEEHDMQVAAASIHADAFGLAAPLAGSSEPADLPEANAGTKVAEASAAPMPPEQIAAPAATLRTEPLRTGQAEPPDWVNIAGDKVAKAEFSKPAEALVPVVAAAAREAAAAAPAPAKEPVKPVEMKPATKEAALVAQPETKKTEAAAFEEGSSFKAGVNDGLSFAAFREQDASPGGGKKILIVAAAVLAIAAVGYFGLSTLGGAHSSVTTRPMPAVPQPQAAEPTPDLTQTPPSAQAHSPASKVNRQVSSSPAPNQPNSQIGHGSIAPSSPGASPEHIAAEHEPAVKEPEREPIVVRPNASARKTQSQTEATVEPPSPIAVALPDNNNLSSLVKSDASVAKPTLAQIKVSQGVTEGLLIKSVPPKYPAEALTSHAQGAVVIEATIDKEGHVVNPKAVSGNSVLAKAALEAVRQWRYKPYYLNGEPVEIRTQIKINFKGN